MAQERPQLFLIDGNSLVYRAFFALPESIATSTGFPTNAIFGFASMLVKILTEYGPQPTVVVWDAGSSGRKEIYSDYKGHRPERPDLLAEQWPHFEPLVDAFGYRNLRVEGYEADDVIASLAEQAKQRGVPVMIVTGDRDTFQLVDDGRVRVMATSRGITDTRVYDRQAVTERYGIPPELSRLREAFREFELREPLRRLEEALGSADAAAPPAAAAERLTAAVRPGALSDVSGVEGDELCIAAVPPEPPEGELLADGPWRFAVSAGRGSVLAGECARPEDLVDACGQRPVVVHDAKALGSVPAELAHV